jgi:hypothetical protein
VTRVEGLPKDSVNHHIPGCPTRPRETPSRKATLRGLLDIPNVYTLIRRQQGSKIVPYRVFGIRKGLGMSKQKRDEVIDRTEQYLAGLLEARLERDF